MSRPSIFIRQVGLVVFLIVLIQVGSIPQGSIDEEVGGGQCPNVNSDLSWFRKNAQALLFMEHLQKRATEENLFDWSKQQGSDQYRSRLRSLENQFVMPEEIPDDCYDQMPIPQKIAQRIAFLEDRLEGCGSAQPCPYAGAESGAGFGSSLMLRRLSVIQAELMRQRNVIRYLRMRLVAINRQCEGERENLIIYRFSLMEFFYFFL